MDDPSLTSLSLTHVYYNPSDRLSQASAFLALAPQALMIIYVSLIWSTREIEILLMFAGQMGCEALNWLLKRSIREERPSQMHGKGYGMPSSHAQFAAFFSTYLTLFLLLRHTPHPVNSPNRSTTHTPIPLYQRFILSLLALATAAAVAQSRIYLNYHKPRQVYVGVGIGMGCAVGWFVVTGLARRTGWTDWVLDLGVVRAVRLRDLVCEEDLVDAGWERWEMRRRKRMADGLVGSGAGVNGSVGRGGGGKKRR